MYAIVYKTDSFPICNRLPGTETDAVVFWNTEPHAQAFLEVRGEEFTSTYKVVAVSDDTLKEMAGAMGIKEEDVQLIPFPMQ
jgi:hypothetical protein